MKDKRIEDQSQAEFENSLQARFQAAQSRAQSKGGKMHMTPAPTGQSRSLDDLLQSDNPGDAALIQGQQPRVLPSAARDAGTRQVRKLPLDLLVDSPYQPRTTYDESKLQLLAAQLDIRGQDEPVRVRSLSDGNYELISGHRRIRAAKLLSWTEVDALVFELDDRSAEIATLVSNESHEQITDWERGLSYQRALDRALAATQAEVAALFSCTQGRVSQCLAMVRLPKPITDLLMRYPSLLNYRHAKIVKEFLVDKPDQVDVVVEAVEAMIDEPKLEPEQLRIRLLQGLAQRKRRASPVEPKFVANPVGLRAFTVRRNANRLTVGFHTKLSPEQQEEAEQQVMVVLKELADKFKMT